MLSQTLMRESFLEALVSRRASVAKRKAFVVSLELSEVVERVFIVRFAFCVGCVRRGALFLGIKKTACLRSAA